VGEVVATLGELGDALVLLVLDLTEEVLEVVFDELLGVLGLDRVPKGFLLDFVFFAKFDPIHKLPLFT